ncbi:MAG TPA: TIGR04076 family protein [Clostridia bacterium]|nr:TIGR04076 family protein [Clostridia bacterium]
MSRVKITVLKKCFFEDLAEQYLTGGKEVGMCDYFEEGDSFIYEGGAVMPGGFCPWAWIDAYRKVSSLSAGATNTPWNKYDGQYTTCCTDGIRPVTFLLERLDT